MMYNYNEIIKNINNHLVSEIDFKVKNYSHYNFCKIIVKKDLLPNKNIIFLIDVFLTKDESEHICFFNEFNEVYKLFRMGRKGNFTLKQIWKDIEILKIISN